MYERELPPTVNGYANMQASDMPASRKWAGAAAHAHNTNPCNFCWITHDDINSLKGYEPAGKQLQTSTLSDT